MSKTESCYLQLRTLQSTNTSKFKAQVKRVSDELKEAKLFDNTRANV